MLTKKIAPLLGFFMMSVSSLNIHADRRNIIEADSIDIRQLHISAGSLIRDILNDVFSECDSTEPNTIYYLYLKVHDQGFQAFITQEHKNMIDRMKFNELIGYAILGKDTIIVSGKQIQDFSYSRNPQPLRLPMHDLMRNDSKEWLYLINEGIFARDGESMGWIWHIPSDSLKDYELTKFAITAPKRTKK